jgi:copper homeostasis protein
MANKITLEICAQSLTSALAAQEGGADRIELCTALEVGGLTPSPATMLEAKRRLTIPVCVLIRPRPGDFIYSDLEYECIKRDVEWCKQHGMDGVVVGILTKEATFDLPKMRELAEIARPMQVVCHRAFDQTPNAAEALEQLIELGFDRVLTSGQAKNVVVGRDILRGLVQQANGRITIMPGNGVNTNNLKDLILHTKATDFHTSAKHTVKSPMPVLTNSVSFNLDGGRENDYFETDSEIVRELVSIRKIM